MIEKLINRAIKMVGSVSKLARQMGVPRQLIEYWRCMGRIPHDKALIMSVVLGGEIGMSDLCPDMSAWHEKYDDQVLQRVMHGEKVAAVYVPTNSLRSTSFRQNIRDIQGLAKNISQNGMLSPIIVNRKMEIVSGERRYAAAKLLKLKKVLVTFLDVDPTEGRYLDNILADPLSPAEIIKLSEARKKT